MRADRARSSLAERRAPAQKGKGGRKRGDLRRTLFEGLRGVSRRFLRLLDAFRSLRQMWRAFA
eukprot:4907647-Pleurochrysis_carterae.AAC.3